jgi:hypothetical protein
MVAEYNKNGVPKNVSCPEVPSSGNKFADILQTANAWRRLKQMDYSQLRSYVKVEEVKKLRARILQEQIEERTQQLANARRSSPKAAK